MNRRACGALLALLSLSLAAFAGDVDWPHYGADQGGTRYTPADQINRDNFDQLRVIWRYRPPRPADIRDGRSQPGGAQSLLRPQPRYAARRQRRALLCLAIQRSRGSRRPKRRGIVDLRPRGLADELPLLG